MEFKGSGIVSTMVVRQVVTEMICDIIVANAPFMHYVRTKGLPLLIKALETKGPRKKIKKMFRKIEAQMEFLQREFERYKNFLAPLKLIQNI